MEGPVGQRSGGVPPAVAVLLVVGAIDDFPDLTPVEGAGAHQAGFDGDVQGGVGEVFAAQIIEGGGKGDDLRVRGAIVEAFGLIVAAGDDAVVLNDDGADGDLVFVEGLLRFFDG